MTGPFEKLLIPLHFPPYPFRLEERGEQLYIFDELRKKLLLCTPEEWVRQHLIQFLIGQKHYPRGLFRVEGGLTVHERRRRSDVLIYSRSGKALLLAECKSPSVRLRDETFQQAALYNSKYQADYLLITNGLQHYCCAIDHAGQSYRFLDDIPVYEEN